MFCVGRLLAEGYNIDFQLIEVMFYIADPKAGDYASGIRLSKKKKISDSLILNEEVIDELPGEKFSYLCVIYLNYEV